jgi:hypothetical protein
MREDEIFYYPKIALKENLEGVRWLCIVFMHMKSNIYARTGRLGGQGCTVLSVHSTLVVQNWQVNYY